MYQKAIVLDIKDSYAIVLTDNGNFLKITKKDGMKQGAKIYILPEDIYKDDNAGLKLHKKRHLLIIKAAAAAAAVLLIFAAVLSIGRPDRVYATVSLDCSESVQFGVDRNNIIKTVHSFTDGITEEDLKPYIGLSLDDISDIILDRIKKDGSTAVVAYAIFSDTDNNCKLANFISNLKDYPYMIKMNGNLSDIESAEENNQSLGMYMMELAIDEDNFEDLIEDLSDDELFRLISGQIQLMKITEYKNAVISTTGPSEKTDTVSAAETLKPAVPGTHKNNNPDKEKKDSINSAGNKLTDDGDIIKECFDEFYDRIEDFFDIEENEAEYDNDDDDDDDDDDDGDDDNEDEDDEDD